MAKQRPTAVGNPPLWTKFAIAGFGGLSGWMFVHPFDVLKVRLQVTETGKTSGVNMMRSIIKNEGFKGLYSGLSAAAARQLSYTTSRIGLYDTFTTKMQGDDGAPLSLVKKIVCGLSAGGIAATCCCPIEVALVRMQTDGMVEASQRRGYRNVFDAIYKTAKTEGVTALWRGGIPNLTRGAVVSMTQLATYDQAKEFYRSSGFIQSTGPILHLSASVTSGFIYCLVSLPIDITKTRMQNQKALPDGTLKYKNMLDALVKIPSQEGVAALWKGFPPYFLRGGGHTVFMFLFVEQYRLLVNDLYSS